MSKLKSLLRNRKGISNIMGALLLVAIVVVAAAGFAVMVSEIQKGEMERRSNIAAVEGEELRIMSIDTTVNKTDLRLEKLDINVLNLDSRKSRLVTVLINDRGANNFTSTDDRGNTAVFSYSRRLKIPAAGSRIISLNFTANSSSFHPHNLTYNVSTTEPLRITLFTERANNFKRIFTPPTAVVKTSIETEDLGVGYRDVLVLDGADSFDDGSILSYRWMITNGANLTGKKVRAILNQTGPFNVSLTVVDDTGMVGISEHLEIPENKNFNPPVRMETPETAYNSTAGDTVNVTVCDINGKPSEGVMVSFIRMMGNVTYSPSGDVTNSSGIASTTLTDGEGIIQIRSGRMNPIEVSVVQ